MAATKRKHSVRDALDQIEERLGSSQRRGAVERMLGASPEVVRARLKTELARSVGPRRTALAEASDLLGQIEREAIQLVVLGEGRDALTRLLAAAEAAEVVYRAMATDVRLIGGWRHAVFGESGREVPQGREYGTMLAKFIATTRDARDGLTRTIEAATGRAADLLRPVAQRLADGGLSHREIAGLLIGNNRTSTRDLIRQRLFRSRHAKPPQEPRPEKPSGPLTVREALDLWAAGESFGVVVRRALHVGVGRARRV